jgi:4-alpha-glucanotransferase
VLHTFISRFAAGEKDPFPQPRTPSAASLGSHDLPKFAAYWRGEDIEDRLGRGEIDATAADVERAERDALIEATAKAAGIKARALHTDAAVRAGLVASLASLAGGPADLLLVDLADLVGQRVPDNRPGTGPEADNWRWRLSRRLDEIAADPAVTSVIEVVHEARVAEATEGVSR